MRRNAAFLIALLFLAGGALAFRLPLLGVRPFHGDEAVHAFKFKDLWEKHVYAYDANEYHGPTIYYASLPSVWLQGRKTFAETQESDYRLPIVLFGAALALLPALLADGIGKRAALCAGILTAISTAFVFYSRYYIQEILLAFFTLGMMACGWRYARTRHPGWLIAVGLCAGLMIASKETAVLTFLAEGVALWLTSFWTNRVDGNPLHLRRYWNGKLAVAALAVCLLTACLFLSGFGTHLAGPVDYLRSYTPWLNRAHGTDIHRHPWNYYLQILAWTQAKSGPVWSEGLIVGLSVIGCISALLPKKRSHLEGSVPLARFLAFYTLVLTFLYSAIPYKTPWCVLSFHNGMILLAGIGAVHLLRFAPGKPLKAVLALLLLAGSVQLGRQSYRASYLDYGDNPYAYAQPVPDAEELGHRVEELAQADPQHDQMLIYVYSTDTYYWPLPWYLRRFPNVGYWTQVRSETTPSIILASDAFDEELSQKLNATHQMPHTYGLRPSVFFEMWVNQDLWARYLSTRKKPKEEPGE